jgi:DNA polymerase III epsilon subunit-like protein
MSNKLVLHVETTGLPDHTGLARGHYPDFRHLKRYDSSRAVRVSWLILDAELFEIERQSYVVKPTDFVIPFGSIQFHGITQVDAMESGTALSTIAQHLERALTTCSVLVGHNLDFSRLVLMSELFREDAFRVLEKVIMLEECCTMKRAREELGRLKYPSLEELALKFLPDEKDTKLGLCAKIFVFFETHESSQILIAVR